MVHALAQLRQDHDFFMRELAREVNEMRETTGGGPSIAETKMSELRHTLTEVRARLKTHNALEEEIVYRLPAKLLDQLKQSVLARGVRKELENVPPRFKNRFDESAN